MNNIDRFLRVLYKDCDLDHLFKLYYSYLDYNTGFNVRNNDCRERLVDLYTSIYPDNYNYESVKLMIDHYSDGDYYDGIDLLRNKVIGNIQKSNDENKKELYINDNIFVYDGIFDKIDINVIISLKFAHDKLNDEEIIKYGSSIINYLNYEKRKEFSLSENHMHLSASGYT
ncbi:MAG: hypothetical protein WBO70_00260, partial [Erysipelotrichaceae bacterium]